MDRISSSVKRVSAGLFLLTSLAVSLIAQESHTFEAVPPSDKWTITTRWDYRVRVNGRYLGFANRELREIYARDIETSDGWRIEGEARVLGATKKNGASVAARLEDRDDVSFVLGRDGSVLEADEGYPRLRGFPTYPEGILEPGDRWEAPIDILISGPEGEMGVLNQIASYSYLGAKPYMDREAHYFNVSWAVRYRSYDSSLSLFLKGLEGSHQVSLVVDGDTGAPIMARDKLSERWIWADSREEQRDGFALIFWDGVPPLDRGGIKREFEDRFPGLVVSSRGGGGEDDDGGQFTEDGLDDGSRDGGMLHGGGEGIIIDDEESDLDDTRSDGDIVIVDTPRGVSVTLRNLHFKPDLAELLPGDRALLDKLAGILESIPDRTVLVRGHTADVGRPEDEMSLSEERARTVADAMSARGIDPRRLIYEGVGAREPLASNATEDGKKLNRRVEFLILED